MNAERTLRLAEFLSGLDALTERTGVEISHREQINLRWTDGGEALSMALTGHQSECHYRLEKPYS